MKASERRANFDIIKEGQIKVTIVQVTFAAIMVFPFIFAVALIFQ